MLRRSISIFLLFFTFAAHAGQPELPSGFTDDWSAVADRAKSRHIPIVLIIESEHCGYCESLTRDVLEPMMRNQVLKNRAMVHRMDLNTSGKLVDFDGDRIRAQIFLGRYKVFATPTLLFLDQDGRPLHAPLVGFNGTDLYRPMLERALREAQGKMASALERTGAETARMQPL